MKWPAWLAAITGIFLFLGIRKRRDMRQKTPQLPPSGRAPQLVKYEPNSMELTALLADAAMIAGVPMTWAADPDIHYIIEHESAGWVGRPNYTYGQENAGRRFGSDISSPSSRDRWPEVWAELREGVKGAKSTATGLGQFILDNVRRYYPSGVDGIGVPLDEAVGIMSYIAERYGSPQSAAQFKRDKGWW